MLAVRQLNSLFFLFSSMLSTSAQQTPDVKPSGVTARARILQQKYCRADADIFTVSLKLRMEFVNSSNTSAYLLWPMIPWVAKIAAGFGDAESGHFLYEETGSHYVQDPIRFERLKIEPGKKVTVQSGYSLIARYDPAFSIAGTVSAGTYALVLVLGPEEQPPSQMQGPETVRRITMDPFVISVPRHPKVVDCEVGAKTSHPTKPEPVVIHVFRDPAATEIESALLAVGARHLRSIHGQAVMIATIEPESYAEGLEALGHQYHPELVIFDSPEDGEKMKIEAPPQSVVQVGTKQFYLC